MKHSFIDDNIRLRHKESNNSQCIVGSAIIIFGSESVDFIRVKYHAYFEKDGKEYLIQFTSNYTISGSSKNAYGITRRTQDECKVAFKAILMDSFFK